MTEKEVQRQILDWLALKGIWHYRVNSGAMVAEYKGKKRFFRFSAKGHPDIVARGKPVGYGFSARVVWIECKSQKGKLSPDQEIWRAEAELHHDVYVVARKLEDIIDVFGE
jgi:hypothetical protein